MTATNMCTILLVSGKPPPPPPPLLFVTLTTIYSLCDAHGLQKRMHPFLQAMCITHEYHYNHSLICCVPLALECTFFSSEVYLLL